MVIPAIHMRLLEYFGIDFRSIEIYIYSRSIEIYIYSIKLAYISLIQISIISPFMISLKDITKKYRYSCYESFTKFSTMKNKHIL